MANALYDYGREGFLSGDIDWLADDIKVALIDTAAYTVDLGNDQFLNIIPPAAIIATSGNLASKTAAAGVADAADITLTSVTGTTVEALVIYQDTGVDATSRLIAYLDTVTGLPFTPSGSDVIIQWASGASKIFKL
jgi:hypothetical protein